MKKILLLSLILCSFVAKAQNPLVGKPSLKLVFDVAQTKKWDFTVDTNNMLEINGTGGTPSIRLTDFAGTGTKVLAIDADGDLVRTIYDPASGVTFGSPGQIPRTNAGATDFDYSSGLTYDGADFAVNTNDLFVDGSAGSIGIGNISPAGLLHVYNSTPTTGATKLIVQAGAGNITGDYILDIRNNAGTTVASARMDGLIGATILSTQDIATGALSNSATYVKGLSLNSTSLIGWSGTATWFSAKDTGLSRIDANKVGVGNGVVGDFSGTLIAGNVGIGTGATVSAKLHAIATTEQLRLGYNATNYFSSTTDANANTTFNLTAASGTPTFTFSDGVNITPTANQLVLGTTNTLTINSAQTSSHTLTLPDATGTAALTSQLYTVTNEANNRVITSTGTNAGNAEANLTFDGSELIVVGNVGSQTTPVTTGNFGGVKVGNISGGVFMDIGAEGTVKFGGGTTTENQLAYELGSGNDSGTNPALQLVTRLTSSSAVAIRPHSAGYNYTTKLWEVSAGGDWDFEGNELSDLTLTAPKIANAGFIADANGNEQIIFNATASAVNEITITNAATTTSPTIAASGGDTNIDLNLNAKGTGIIKSNAEIALNGASMVSDNVLSMNAGSAGGLQSWVRSTANADMYMAGTTDVTGQLTMRCNASGGVYLAAGGTSWTAVSDERQKYIYNDITKGLDVIKNWRPIIYRYNQDADSIRRVGVTAQSILATRPEAVTYNAEKDVYGVSYSELVPDLIASIQEQQKLIEALTARLEALEKKK